MVGFSEKMSRLYGGKKEGDNGVGRRVQLDTAPSTREERLRALEEGRAARSNEARKQWPNRRSNSRRSSS